MRRPPSASIAPRSHRRAKGYALLIVLLVLGLMSVGLGTLLYFLEASAQTTGSMLERRRVFYACDGIGRAATVLAQKYMVTAVPSSAGLIKSVCTDGGGGCCPSSSAGGACDTGSPPALASRFTVLTADPDAPGPSALPKIVPAGFKVKQFQIESLAQGCTNDSDCTSGTCVLGACRIVAPLPNGPFQGMNARQDTIAIAVRAEHTATTQFACKTRQTLTLGKIAMFQFFLFSDSTYTDWHPGPSMRASGRMHANGDLGIEQTSPVTIERVTAFGDIRCIDGSGAMSAGDCTAADGSPGDARIANRLNPDFSNTAHFSRFRRRNTTWTQDALNDYGNGNAQDKAHGVPRLQLPVVGSPDVQRGFDAGNNVIDNVNLVGTAKVNNSRLLIDPVRATDPVDVKEQKFAHKADIRIINGVWYLKNPANPDAWPGIPVWSDHGTYARTPANDLVSAADPTPTVGQRELAGAAALSWSSRVPRRYSYYAMDAVTDELLYDKDGATVPTTSRSVISYGALFRDASAGRHAAVWRPGVRTLRTRSVNATGASRESWCEAGESDQPVFSGMLDALALDNVGSPCSTLTPAVTAGFSAATPYSRGSALIAATRSGFRDGFAEHSACTTTDLTGTCASRALGNMLPMNLDVNALQDALADTTSGELGSFFCAPGVATCGRLMGRPFNGIIYVAAPYPGSENGYGSAGGVAAPARPLAPTQDDASSSGAEDPLNAAVGADGTGASDGAGNWTTTAPLPILRDHAGMPTGDRTDLRDDEINAVPFPLCSNDAGSNSVPDVTTGDAGTELTKRGYIYRRPLCSGTTSRLTALRIINARRVNFNLPVAPALTAPTIAEAGQLPTAATAPVLANVGQLPNGLSIVTNLPVYVVGDVNITSDAYATDLTRQWVPVLVAGDVMHLLSNDWDDRKSRWGLSAAASQLRDGQIRDRLNNTTIVAQDNSVVPRRATVTRWYMEILAGWGMTVTGARSGGIHNFPRFLEDWQSDSDADCDGTFVGDCPAIIHGSIVIGHNRVYTQWPFADNDNANGRMGRKPPRRDWGFDRHLEDLERQPPGAPVYDVSAIQQWSRN